MDQHPAMIAMSSQQRARDIAADVQALGQPSAPTTFRGLLGFFAEVLRGSRAKVTTPLPRPIKPLATPSQ